MIRNPSPTAVPAHSGSKPRASRASRSRFLAALVLAVTPLLGAVQAEAVDVRFPRPIVIGRDPDDSGIVVDVDLDDPLDEQGEDCEPLIGVEDVLEIQERFDFQRVDGITLGLTQRIEPHGAWAPIFTFSEARAFHRGRWLFEAGIEQPLLPDLLWLSVGANFFRRTELFDGLDHELVDDTENLLAALLIKEDYRDYFEHEGIETFIAHHLSPETAWRLTLVRSEHRPVYNSTRTSLTRWGEDFRVNPAAETGDLRAFRIEFEHDTRPRHHAPATAQWYRLAWERADGGLGGDFDYGRFLADLRQYVRTSPGQRLSWRIIYGTNRTGQLPAQKRFAIGGIGTLRAHGFKQFEGEDVLLGNVEYAVDVADDFNALVFVDTGATATSPESLEDRKFALDGGFGFGFDGERAAIYIARDLRDPSGDFKVSFRLSSTF